MALDLTGLTAYTDEISEDIRLDSVIRARSVADGLVMQTKNRLRQHRGNAYAALQIKNGFWK